MATSSGAFGAKSMLSTSVGDIAYYNLNVLDKAGIANLERLPYSIRILLENALRCCGQPGYSEATVEAISRWNPTESDPQEIPFTPARVVLQDFTGVPCIVDLAAMRDAMKKLGGDPAKINPIVPVDLVIDHSVQVDEFGRADALDLNVHLEFVRNRERYEFLKWGQRAFRNLQIVPPSSGIVHQVNLEYLARGVFVGGTGGESVAYPDSLVGTDSHTTMINGLGVLGWGVGGIEAEACMLGQPVFMLMPEVVGFRLTGKLREGTNATDLVLTATQMLRAKGVVGKFVEFFGAGLSQISLADRATIANMAPEYGATMGFFPADAETIAYLRRTGRPETLVELNEKYLKAQGLYRTDDSPEPEFSAVLELDLSTVAPSLAGPKRPQDRVPLVEMKTAFRAALSASKDQRGFGLSEAAQKTDVRYGETGEHISHGAVAIAAITSCTNTSNPSVMVAAGLVAKKAVERGLNAKPWVKTSLAPGSKVVTSYLDKAGLSEALDKIGFHTVGYGCTTCIGNSGPLPNDMSKAISSGDLIAAAVLSGNRNFEGRVHPQVKANYLASPPLVVAYALAGTVDIDLAKDPLDVDSEGAPVYLHDVWPTSKEISDAIALCLSPDLFIERYGKIFEGDELWRKIEVKEGVLYNWDENSTYIQHPPFFENFGRTPPPLQEITGARVLVKLGDSVTTDHISPAGNIKADSPAGRYLQEVGVGEKDFNSYGSRRGNDRIMTRGTFANIRLRNLQVPGSEGNVTIHYPSGDRCSIFAAAEKYKAEGVSTIVLAGAEYGTGSSRDWAAKGTLLLGVKAVIALSFERIHRSNLVGMGVLPLQFQDGQNYESLGLSGDEEYDILGVADGLSPRELLTVLAKEAGGEVKTFKVICRIDTPVEVEYFENGGILQTVLRRFLSE